MGCRDSHAGCDGQRERERERERERDSHVRPETIEFVRVIFRSPQEAPRIIPKPCTQAARGALRITGQGTTLA